MSDPRRNDHIVRKRPEPRFGQAGRDCLFWLAALAQRSANVALRTPIRRHSKYDSSNVPTKPETE